MHAVRIALAVSVWATTANADAIQDFLRERDALRVIVADICAQADDKLLCIFQNRVLVSMLACKILNPLVEKRDDCYDIAITRHQEAARNLK